MTSANTVFNNKGMALLLTLISLSLLVIVTIQFHKTIWNNYQQAHTSKIQIQLQQAALSGLNIGRYLIAQKDGEPRRVDSHFNLWKTATKKTFDDLFPRTKLQLNIVDGESKLNINFLTNVEGTEQGEKKAILYRKALYNLLISHHFQLEPENAQSLVDALTDWIDANDLTRTHGAEDDYYNTLNPAYNAHNKPVIDTGDLLAVRGMTKELLFGATDKEHNLASFISTIGSKGALNINTVSPVLLRFVFPQLTEALIQSIIEFRENIDNQQKLVEIDWYKKIIDWPQDIVLPHYALTTSSSAFLITSTAQQQKRTFTVTATAQTEGDKVRIINRRLQY